MLPTPRLIYILCLASLFFLVGAIIPAVATLGVAFLFLITMYGLLDLFFLYRLPKPHIERTIPSRLFLDVPSAASFQIQNFTKRSMEIRIAENLPLGLFSTPDSHKNRLSPRQSVDVSYQLTATQRGDFEWSRVDVRLRLPFGLFFRQYSAELPAFVQVHPNALKRRWHELIVNRSKEPVSGLSRIRRTGLGTELESLRPYRHSDPLSIIDWKATAKHHQLISRNYEEERRQTIWVLLDIGRTSAAEYNGIRQLDIQLDAILILAYTALCQGDQFGLLVFSDRMESCLNPLSGPKQIERVSSAVYALQPRRVESDYALACEYLNRHFRKRSLICMMTGVLDKTSNSVLLRYMAHFARNHLPLCITVRNPDISRLVEQPLLETPDFYQKCAAVQFWKSREETLQIMRQSGVDVLDTLPQNLTVDLVQRYLLMKEYRRI